MCCRAVGQFRVRRPQADGSFSISLKRRRFDLRHGSPYFETQGSDPKNRLESKPDDVWWETRRMAHEVWGRHLADPSAFPWRDDDLTFVTAVHILRHKAVISKIGLRVSPVMCDEKLFKWLTRCGDVTCRILYPLSEETTIWSSSRWSIFWDTR